MKKTVFTLLALFMAVTMIFSLAACNNNDGEIQDLKNRINQLERDLADAKSQEGIKGDKGEDGLDGKDGLNGKNGDNGKDGLDGLSAYEIFKRYYPDYTGNEFQWLDDYLNGRLAFTMGLKFTLIEDGTAYEVSKGTANTNGEIVIPSTFNGLPITKIATNINGFMSTKITQITIPKFMTSIATTTLVGCQNLKNIIFEDDSQLNTIGNFAFLGCTSLENIIIPSTVTSIGNSAFARCSSLESIAIPKSVTNIGNSAFAYCSNLESIIFESGSRLETIGHQPLYGCTSLESISIPANVTSIGYGLAFDCSSISVDIANTVYRNEANCIIRIADNVLISGCKNSIIPDNVTQIDFGAFYNCINLERITIPENVTNIGGSAFDNCASLKNITIPANVTNIGRAAFSGCANLENVTFESNGKLDTIDGFAFSRTNLKSVIIPASVTNIGAGVFSNCDSLSVESANTVYKSEGNCIIRIADNVLISGGKNSVMPSSITKIASYAFSHCSNIESIIFEKDSRLLTIEDYAFYDCSSLTTLVIPPSVKNISIYAFYILYTSTKIFYGGNSSQWSLVKDEDGNAVLTDTTIYFYSETKITSGTHWRYVDGIPTIWE